MMNKDEKKLKGFTIIELIISLAIFFFIIGSAIILFISIIQNQKRILAEQQMASQISYLQEHMAKAIRMAAVPEGNPCGTKNEESGGKEYVYLLTDYDGAFFRGIKFFQPDGTGGGSCYEFFWDKDDESGTNEIKEIITAGVGSSDIFPLTSPNHVDINYVKFSVNGGDGTISGQDGCLDDLDFCGAEKGNGIQPKVTILMNVFAPEDPNVFGKSCTDDDGCPDSKCNTSTGKCRATRTIQTTVSQRNLNLDY